MTQGPLFALKILTSALAVVLCVLMVVRLQRLARAGSFDEIARRRSSAIGATGAAILATAVAALMIAFLP